MNLNLGMNLLGGGKPALVLPAANLSSIYGFGVDGSLNAGEFWWNPKRNYFNYSEDFSNAASWGFSRASWVSATKKLTEDSTASNTHGIYSLTAGMAGIVGQVYTFRVRLKASERTWAYLSIGAITTCTAYFDLTNGVVGTTGAGTTATITDAGGGWWDCVISKAATGTASVNPACYIATANGTSSYTGNGSSGIYLSQMQLSVGSSTPAAYELTNYNNPYDWGPAAINAFLGSSATTVASDMAPLVENGVYVGYYAATTYALTPNRTRTMDTDRTVYLVVKPSGTTGTLFSIADATVTNKYHEVRYASSGNLLIATRNGTGAETTSSNLAVPTTSWLMLEFKLSSGTLSLTRMDTGASVTLTSQGANSTPRFGIAVRAASTVTSIADSLKIAACISYDAALGAAAAADAYAFTKKKSNDATLRNLGVL